MFFLIEMECIYICIYIYINIHIYFLLVSYEHISHEVGMSVFGTEVGHSNPDISMIVLEQFDNFSTLLQLTQI